jgi:hypothetical protein
MGKNMKPAERKERSSGLFSRVDSGSIVVGIAAISDSGRLGQRILTLEQTQMFNF